MFEDFNGEEVDLSTLPIMAPGKLAVAVVRRMFSPEYLMGHVFEPKCSLKVTVAAPAEDVNRLKRKLSPSTLTYRKHLYICTRTIH